MPEETSQNTPGSSGTESQALTPADTTPKTFTQEDVDRVVSERLNRQKGQFEGQLKTAREQAAAEALAQAQLTEAEKYKLELEQQKAELQTERDRATKAERKAALVGKVADVDAALKLLEPDHILEDGSINTEAFLGRYPFLASTNKQPDPTAGGGSSGKPGVKDYTTVSKAEYEKERERVLRGAR